jgi:hypothetical protein
MHNAGFSRSDRVCVILVQCTICPTLQSRIATQSDCNTAVNNNAGCGALVNTTVSYGPSFNDNGGGWLVICLVCGAGVLTRLLIGMQLREQILSSKSGSGQGTMHRSPPMLQTAACSSILTTGYHHSSTGRCH